MVLKPTRLGALLFATAMAMAPSALAQTLRPSPAGTGNTDSTEEPVLITADQITHDRDLETVNASGHVEIDQGGQTLLADSLSYNVRQDVIVASGNVSLTEPTGEVSFADYMELTGDMKTAVARRIRVLMIDDSRLAAATGKRVQGKRNILEKGVYTACKPCAENPQQPPLWDVKAKRITHDETKHVIEYEDAWLEIDGVPTAYTPYLQHADPTVHRKSGLMPPTFVNNNILGFGVRPSYFQVIDPYQDITIAPLVTDSQWEQLAAVHRWRSTNGEGKTTASIADMPVSSIYSKETIGWHINSKAVFDANENWRTGWDIARASDRDYLRAFSYQITDPYLTTRAYAERFSYRDFTSIEAYSFQNLSDNPPVGQTLNTQSKQPVVFPLVTYSHVSDAGALGDRLSFDARTASINRSQGTNSRRVNTLTTWQVPYTARDGELYRLSTSLRADGYNSDHLTIDSPGQVNIGRTIPQASLDWRYPFGKVGNHSSQTISPIVVTTLSPYGGNPTKIPNEDSLDFELDDINVFSPTPFNGYDRVLTGPHVAYGAEYNYVNRGQLAFDAVVGQLYQAHPAAIFEQGTGIDDHFSDIVGRATVSPSANFNVAYRYRVKHDDGSMRRSEVDTTLGPRPLRLTMNYVFFAKLSPTSPYDQREQVSGQLTSQFSQYWSTQFYTTQDIGPNAGNLDSGVRLTYEDECLSVTADLGTSDTTIKNTTLGTHLVLRFDFKTLTELPVSIY